MLRGYFDGQTFLDEICNSRQSGTFLYFKVLSSLSLQVSGDSLRSLEVSPACVIYGISSSSCWRAAEEAQL